jgi:hypothetical protein
MGYWEGVATGFQHGLERAARDFGLQVDPSADVFIQTQDSLDKIFDQWPFSLSDRFVAYIAESLGIAAAARSANGYPPLTNDQIIGFLGHSSDIFDSLKCA